MSVVGDNERSVMPGTSGQQNNKWTKDETLALLHLYRDVKHKFASPRYKNVAVWREIAESLQKIGVDYTADQVEGRWKTLLAAYRRVVDHNKKVGMTVKSFSFWMK